MATMRVDPIEVFSDGKDLAIGWDKDLHWFEGAMVQSFEINHSMDSWPEIKINLSLIAGSARVATDERQHLHKMAERLTIGELFQVINEKMEKRS